MLSVSDIQFLVEQDVNLGSFEYRDREPEELDEAINATVYVLAREALDKEVKKRDAIENLLIRGLTKQYCQSPIDNFASVPTDYMDIINTSALIIRTTCAVRVCYIKEGNWYRAEGDVLYAGKWYRKGEIFNGSGHTDVFGHVDQVTVKPATTIELEPDMFNSYPPSMNVVYYTIVGQLIELKPASPIVSFCIDYVSNIGDEFKMNSCTGQTLGFDETIQRWVIERTVLRLAIRNEESQQKITNMKS